MVSLPIEELGKLALAMAALVIVIVQMAKAIGLTGSRRQAACAVLVGQVLALAHWAVAWKHSAEMLYYAALVGIVATAMAMGFWQSALKRALGEPSKPLK